MPESVAQPMKQRAKSAFNLIAGGRPAGMSTQEIRCAVRFPLALPVVISWPHGEVNALTRNVSASGVLFETDGRLRVGENIRFSLRMPGAVLGASHDVLVDCRGRVVRSSISQSHAQVAATIDEYRFLDS